MFLYSILQEAHGQNATVQAAIVTSIGLIIVALIGVFTARAAAGSKKDAKQSSESASISAQTAKDYADALKAKDAFIGSLEDRLKYIEKRLEDCENERRRDDESAKNPGSS